MKLFHRSEDQAVNVAGPRLALRGPLFKRGLLIAIACAASAAVHAQDTPKAKPAKDAAPSESFADRAGRAIERGITQAAQAVEETAVKTSKGLKEGGAKLAAGAETYGKKAGEVAETVVEKTGEGLKKVGSSIDRSVSGSNSNSNSSGSTSAAKSEAKK